jgi:hypothetical protein
MAPEVGFFESCHGVDVAAVEGAVRRKSDIPHIGRVGVLSGCDWRDREDHQRYGDKKRQPLQNSQFAFCLPIRELIEQTNNSRRITYKHIKNQQLAMKFRAVYYLVITTLLIVNSGCILLSKHPTVPYRLALGLAEDVDKSHWPISNPLLVIGPIFLLQVD